MLEFIPEPFEKLKARYPEAIVFTWVMTEDMKTTPGQCRENIFDFEDGVRLIISREKLPGDKREIIHFSGSINKEYYKQEPQYAKLTIDMAEKFYKLSGNENPYNFVGLSLEKQIPHWYVKP